MESPIDKRVARKYRIVGQPIGRGSYGTVWKATRTKGTVETVWALKRCHDPFRNAHDAQGMFREVMILRALKHDNIVRLKEVLRDGADKDLYLVFEFVDTTVQRIIESGQLQDKHKACIMHQLLNAVQYVHSAEIVHRDLKPANLLISAQCQLRLADFGEARSLLTEGPMDDKDNAAFSSPSPSAQFMDAGEAGAMTECGFTLWYNAPEVICGSTTYGKPVDIWSCGCVLGEMLNRHRRPIFTGTSQVDQLTRHVALIGLPNGEADISDLDSPHAFNMMRSVPRSAESKVRSSFPDAPEEALSLLCRMLTFSPTFRPTAKELLSHPFLAEFHDPQKELGRAEGAVHVDFEGMTKLAASQYRDALYTRLGLGSSSQERSGSYATPGAAFTPTSGSVARTAMSADQPLRSATAGNLGDSEGSIDRQVRQSRGGRQQSAPVASPPSSLPASPAAASPAAREPGPTDALLGSPADGAAKGGGGCCCTVQ